MLMVASKKSYGEPIKAARQKAGLSQAVACRHWGFNQAILSMWENGQRNPCGLYRQKLERILKRIEDA